MDDLRIETKQLYQQLEDGLGDVKSIDVNPEFSGLVHTWLEPIEDKAFQFDLSYLRMAKLWAQNSKAERRKVGCIVVNNGGIISDGFNGTVAGFNNTCENPDGSTKREVVHAEINAFAKLAKGTQSADGSTVYVTVTPCVECSKLMIQAGVKRVVFAEFYRDLEGINWLIRKGIDLRFIDLTKFGWDFLQNEEPWQNVFGWIKPTD